ncbi:cyclase family protein [Arthrobacter zhangbolii]|uniref:Cyclase family protein n=1 Tax=Arthrobacter zhangbolii TaxID=2886936 RepID=A0A9X1S9W2_9MICC|nr:cyclase family protein [Arthrobacter zhangbolii]MCC3273553.1 cyclase family protein [Arthrobacter zhangbolii]UON92366.1 cyclase family protein [Arthrobacter zhangbolii]
MPTYDELASAEPPGSSWNVFGRDDQLGTINFLTPERVASAARLVRTGRRFGLDHPVTAFEPYPTGTRRPLEHTVFSNNTWHRDDWVDSFYLQSSSQIDALRHIGHPEHGFYNGLSTEENTSDSIRLGIQNWAGPGIAGRGVLLDVPRFFAQQGLSYDSSSTIAIGTDLLDEIAESQNVSWHGGEILLLRTAWAEDYLAKTPEKRRSDPWKQSPGLAQRESTLRWLWDHEISLVAADNLAVEADPVIDSDFRSPADAPPPTGVDHSGMLHRPLLALLGMALGELWKLDELAADCAEDGVYECFLTCKPLNIPGGVGSPPNAIAFK